MLITNIKTLYGLHTEDRFLRGPEMAALPALNNAYLRVEGEVIIDYGPMSKLPTHLSEDPLDAGGGLVLPAWCDAHTHLVFAGTREDEFVQKIRGLSYAEIAEKGGGIQRSAAWMQAVSEEELFRLSLSRIYEIMQTGTAAVEIKSGYGLTVESELKMLRVIRRLQRTTPLLIRSTFLGAHAVPARLRDRREAYIREIIEEMLPRIANEQLADYIDVFCERGFFDLRETQRILEAGRRCGLKPKLHANQLNNFGAVQLGVSEGALSVDHLEQLSAAEIHCLRESDTIPVLLPGAAFFLRMPFPPARAMIEAGLGIAVASDYNPGSAPSGNMPYLLSLSCIQMRLLPAEAVNAMTLNGACAMEVEQLAGSIRPDKLANLIITQPVPDLAYLPYAFGSNWIRQVIIKGKVRHENKAVHAQAETLP